jgi:hypothetical protein
MLEVLERDVARLPELLASEGLCGEPPSAVPRRPGDVAAELETASRRPVQLGLF